ncbi:MAG: MTH1187 family thiamine-binding protein, partial [Ignavibacteriaceae bacterium]|nr:MTH1187 family thiamine-binding protein [Ignavibacteriaceae bacterium]
RTLLKGNSVKIFMRRYEGNCRFLYSPNRCRALGIKIRVGVRKILTDAGLKTKLHAYGTNIEGEWDDVFAAIKKCHTRIHEMGSPRISSTLRFGTRTDRDQTIEDKIESVENKLRLMQ